MNLVKSLLLQIPGNHKLKNFLKQDEIIRQLISNPFLTTFLPGHFYSPLPNLAEVVSNQERLFQHDVKYCQGIDLAEHIQIDMMERIALFYHEISFPDYQSSNTRYYYQNNFFSYSDAIILYGMLRHLKPDRVIEVGSGFSSAVMLDTSDVFLDKKVQFTFIEPYPERLFDLLNESDKIQHNIITTSVQDVELKVFESLNESDILFVDSSHVVKIGSDVAYLFSEVFPRLKPGVIIHIHDIFWKFEYPLSWIEEGRAWNEAYFLRCFLQYNSAFEIIYFNSFIGYFHQDKLEQKMPLCLKNTGGSIWLRKTR
jgi:predicted O-methyltransferase YrrM